jgi:hypothetical protein
MTKLEKVKILEENNIEWMIGKGRTLFGLVKMSTPSGDDCSEWIDASDIIESLKETERYFKRL